MFSARGIVEVFVITGLPKDMSKLTIIDILPSSLIHAATLIFIIRKKFIRTLSLKFGETLRTFWMLKLIRFFKCS